MSIADLIKHIRISPRHVCDKQIRLCDLVVEPRKNVVRKDLLVDALAVGACRFRSRSNRELVGVVELLRERHQHEYERLGCGVGH
jgi:hypothetical protein